MMADEEEGFIYKEDEWKPISLMYIDYPKGDIVGHLLAWASLIPFFLIGSFVTVIFFRRELHTMCFFVGLVLNEPLNLVLKYIIKEPRPARGRKVLHTVYGMPSSHSQFMIFFSTYLLLFLFIRAHHNTRFLENLWKYFTCTASFVVSSSVLVSRVYLGYHTQRQVVYGAAAGAVFAVVWFFIVHKLLTPVFPTVTSWRISEFFMVRDSTLIPNVLWFDYTSHRSEVRSRLRKNSSARKLS